MDRGAWQATVHRITKSWAQLRVHVHAHVRAHTHTHTHTLTATLKKIWRDLKFTVLGVRL